jgi:DNA-binding MarR family transcriptional regulator
MPDLDPPLVDDEPGKTVRLTDQDIRDAARLFKLLAGSNRSERPTANVIAPSEGETMQEELARRARSIFGGRQLRTSFFSRSIFGEPAWDVLLVLYIMDASDARQTIGKLADWIKVPPTTVLRWVGYLEKERLVERQRHPTDRRVVFIRLVEKGRLALEAYLRAMPLEAFA